MSDDVIDRPTDVRNGEELDVEALQAYLCDAIDGFQAPVELRQFRSGYSNLTYFLKSGDGREFVLRRPPFGADVKTGHDMQREYRVLSALHPVFDRAPKPYVHVEDDEIIGAPFYVMERVEGIILRGGASNVPGFDDPPTVRRACEALIDTLVDIHDVDLDAAGLTEFGRPEGYVRRQIEGWTRRYDKAKTDDIDTIDRVAEWLAANMPDDQPGALIHNDFKYDNVVYDPGDFGRVIAVLDWEMSTVGDPLMDLGTSLAYWIEEGDDPALQAVAGPTAVEGNYTRHEVVERYASRSGRDVDDIVFYYVYGLFKLAGIGQQIYYRYDQGHTDDERFAGLTYLVRACGDRAVATIERGEV